MSQCQCPPSSSSSIPHYLTLVLFIELVRTHTLNLSLPSKQTQCVVDLFISLQWSRLWTSVQIFQHSITSPHHHRSVFALIVDIGKSSRYHQPPQHRSVFTSVAVKTETKKAKIYIYLNRGKCSRMCSNVRMSSASRNFDAIVSAGLSITHTLCARLPECCSLFLFPVALWLPVHTALTN